MFVFYSLFFSLFGGGRVGQRKKIYTLEGEIRYKKGSTQDTQVLKSELPETTYFAFHAGHFSAKLNHQQSLNNTH